MNVISINNITKDYGRGQGIFDVSFDVKQGEVVGFLGANGAGKTTTIRHLMGFIKSETGSADLFGLSCFDEAANIQRDVGYLPGEISFMENMTGLAFIEFMGKMKGITDMSFAHELIRTLELEAHTKIRKMSKGMKQKIGLVIAFMQDAPLLILDEPTSGLDPLMQKKFVELIGQAQSKGKTILMSSHMFEEVEHTCNRIIMIKEGRIVIDETMEDIRKKRSKHYTLTFKDERDAFAFHKLYPSSHCRHNVVTLLDKDNVQKIIADLQSFEILDFDARSQNLEEVFLQYYGGEKI